MGERKVLNKYFPPDFDPAKLPRGKRKESNEMKVRMMLPMSVRCKTCGNYMYKGTKFNTRKEDVQGENYLGIQILRFYYRCTNCAAEFCMKTDPKNQDYCVEGGASRNFEPWREEERVKAMSAQEREEEERGNAMKALENRTLDSKREMDILAALDELRTLKGQQSKVTTEQALAALHREAELEDAVAEAAAAVVMDEKFDLSELFELRRRQQEQEKQKERERKRALHGGGAQGGPSAKKRSVLLASSSSSSASSSASGDDSDVDRKGARGARRAAAGPLSVLPCAAQEEEEEASSNEVEGTLPRTATNASAENVGVAVSAGGTAPAAGGSSFVAGGGSRDANAAAAKASGAATGGSTAARPAAKVLPAGLKLVAVKKPAPPPLAKPVEAPSPAPPPAEEVEEGGGGLGGLFGDYDSDDKE